MPVRLHDWRGFFLRYFRIVFDVVLRLFACREAACPIRCKIRTVDNGIVSHCRKSDEKVRTIYFCYSHVSILETRFWNILECSSKEPCYVSNTADGVHPHVFSKNSQFFDFSHEEPFCPSSCGIFTSNFEYVAHFRKQSMKREPNFLSS